MYPHAITCLINNFVAQLTSINIFWCFQQKHLNLTLMTFLTKYFIFNIYTPKKTIRLKFWLFFLTFTQFFFGYNSNLLTLNLTLMKHFVSCEGEQNFKTEIENVEFNDPTIICWENFRSFFFFSFSLPCV